MSKMSDHLIGLQEEGKIQLDVNGDYIMNEFDNIPPPSKPQFTIEKDVPMPSVLKHKDRWNALPFAKMEVGDSFVVDEMHTKEDETSLRGRATRENNKPSPTFFSVVKNPDLANSFRVFRIQ